MMAVNAPPTIVRTICNEIFFTSTIDFYQPDGLIIRPRTKPRGTGSTVVPQLSAEDGSSIDVPVVLTNSAPSVIIIDLHPAFQIVSSSHQPHTRRGCVIYSDIYFGLKNLGLHGLMSS